MWLVPIWTYKKLTGARKAYTYIHTHIYIYIYTHTCNTKLAAGSINLNKGK